jgi:hypothetical protein
LEKTKEKINEKKEKLGKLKKKRKKKGKVKKKIKNREESLWITVVIHSEMCVGKTMIPPHNLEYVLIYIYKN